jgi:hypothetical protein
VLHALNHLYDVLNGVGGWDQTLALLVFAGLNLAALWQVVRYRNRSSASIEKAVPSAWTQTNTVAGPAPRRGHTQSSAGMTTE